MVAVVLVVLASVLFVLETGSGGLRRTKTPWRAASAFGPSKVGGAGSWQLVDDLLSGNWRQYIDGPPGGGVCPTAQVCYVMAGHFASASSVTPEYDSFYVSSDDGATWAVLPMPVGFAATSPLSCAAATWCAAGGTDQGQAVLVSTSDGGHRFTISPLPAEVGKVSQLVCPRAGVCDGLAFTQSYKGLPLTVPVDATFLSTTDGGRAFTNTPIVAGASIYRLACTSSEDCLAMGTMDQATTRVAHTGTGVVARTTDGGRTWRKEGSFPAGFLVAYDSLLSCPGALRCYVVGFVPSSPSTLQTRVNGIAVTSNGGATWAQEALPPSVTRPFLIGLSCPTTTECWVSGSSSTGTSGTRPMLLGTTNGGTTWSKVTFTRPSGAPNYQGESYLNIGQISCPTAGVCVAWGATAVSSPTAPVYSVVGPTT